MTAERGWIGEPQPAHRDPIPGEERKWRTMMGGKQFTSEEAFGKVLEQHAGALEMLAEHDRG